MRTPRQIARLAAARLRPPRAVPAPLRRGLVAAAAVPVALVAAMAGLVSYSHITALGLRTYQGYADSHLLAVPIDGLIVAGSVILAAGSSLGWLGIALGVAATLFANLQFGLPHGPLPAAVSTWPAIAFTVACFMLERWLRSRRRAHDGDPDPGAARSALSVPLDSLDAAIHAMLATAAAGNPLSGRQLEARFGLKRNAASRVRELVLASLNGHPAEEVPESR